MRANARMLRSVFGNYTLRRKSAHAVVLSLNMILNWFDTISQFRHVTLQCPTIFFDARYNIFLNEPSLANDGLFFVILRNCRFNSSMMFVVYIIFHISAGYAKNVVRISPFSSQLRTQFGYFDCHLSLNSMNAFIASSSVTAW